MASIHRLPYGPSPHYPFVEQYPLGQNQNREGTDVASANFNQTVKKKKKSHINISCNKAMQIYICEMYNRYILSGR